MRNCFFLPFLFLFWCSSCSQPKAVSASAIDQAPLAFPGAEGFGKYTTGGRGGQVLIVSSLEDDGPGTLRQALKTKDSRIIVFALSGTIHLASPLVITGDVTIAGQTAPGDGICLADYPVSMKGNNIIVRFIRFRMGDKAQKGGMVNGNGGDDAFGGLRNRSVIIDHCTMSWSTDEAFSVYAGDSVTLQWNLISEPLNFSYHFETGDKDYEHHGYGGIWGGFHATFHHNLFAHCANRTPRFDGIRNIPSENCDYRNNVIYNWASNNVYAGEGGTYNVVNNYYKWGPATNENVKERVVNPYKTATIPFGKFYVAGNYIDGSPAVTKDNWLGVVMNNGDERDKKNALLNSPWPAEPITTQSATDAYTDVLNNAGAILPKRDSLDQRIINEVRNRKGHLIDVQGGFPHGTDYEKTMKARPVLLSTPPPPDTDKDGMPDEWEKKNRLNPQDASDASGYQLNKQYTNIEVYLNSLVPVKK